MDVSARVATPDDLITIAALYRDLEAEMIALKRVWPFTEGLAEPIATPLSSSIDDDRCLLLIAEAFGAPAGFLLGRIEGLLPQADGATHGVIRLIFTEQGFREIGVGETMMKLFLEWAASHRVTGLDAHVSPGHRLAKNFFESNGFKARHIVMHNDGG
ncbi:GNAT family N-acetyltransferase [bacterium]|nr:GNAT family N-acetyltransferase [bacterium]